MQDISEVKKSVVSLLGKPIKISVNKGRRRTVRYSGSVTGVYPSVFTLRIDGERALTSLSCTYSDLICGDVKIKATT